MVGTEVVVSPISTNGEAGFPSDPVGTIVRVGASGPAPGTVLVLRPSNWVDVPTMIVEGPPGKEGGRVTRGSSGFAPSRVTVIAGTSVLLEPP